jgi:hypothetical protein
MAAKIAINDNDRIAVGFMTVDAQERIAEKFATLLTCGFR